MIGIDLELSQCVVLVLGNQSANKTVAKRLSAQGCTLLFAEEPAQGLELIGQASLLMICDAAPQRFDEVVSNARIPVMRSEPSPATGTITLLGGGPGALDLLTLRGVRALAEAEIIYADRLGPSEHLALLAPQAKIIDAGKLPGHHKLTQREIEAQMIASAQSGAKVLRLKGGDPYVFGRGFEEVAAATKAGVPVSVIPGLSSCITVPGAAGIPVTARGVNTMFTVVSGHDPLGVEQLEQLSKLGGSIVILMGMGTIEQTVSGLLQVGMAKDMPCAIIQSGTTEAQSTSHATLDGLAAMARSHSNPAVIVIGEVAALPQSLLQAVPTENILESAK
ncbi:uroporphyrinogen-III C-methyltransferase [Glutamicibacter sp. JC586]|uniref:uroporphyrinogen-III C-methyltransferase n=1 Tax=Glutamicibacter sp. JC586 TaxID=2590552 RepID=UPI001356FB4E|nr:uroporphyrinogen-III C-methyltransferase [Glutamicibacter sp. JC586]